VPERIEAVALPLSPERRLMPVLLLVEDDPGDALLVEELLADSGLVAELRWVPSLADALVALAVDLPPQCVLLDLHLPDSQGLSGVASILKQAPAAAVVVLTGLAEQQAGLAAVAAGAQDYLVKGRVDPELFGRAIRYAVQRKQAEQAANALQAERMRAEENARLERGLLPVPLLNQAPIVVTARYRPGRASALVGGDFYDVVEADDGIVHAVIGDVAGHGPDEAALGVCLRIAWRTLVLSGISGPRLLRQLERILLARAGPLLGWNRRAGRDGVRAGPRRALRARPLARGDHQAAPRRRACAVHRRAVRGPPRQLGHRPPRRGRPDRPRPQVGAPARPGVHRRRHRRCRGRHGHRRRAR
jgi:CheY-like chemotaxis protein